MHFKIFLSILCLFGLFFVQQGCIAKTMTKENKIVYPYVASARRKKEILEGVRKIHLKMHVDQVKKIMGEPDEMRDNFRNIKGKGKRIGFRYLYFLQKKKKYGSVIERDEKLIWLEFGNDEKLQKIYNWSHPVKN